VDREKYGAGFSQVNWIEGKKAVYNSYTCPDNVQRAIEEVEPYAVDVCSGVRKNGKLDRRKLERFVNNVVETG
jgi:hypothetical protein